MCACVSLCLNKGGKECGRGVRAHVCVEQKNVRPVKYLEIQLNYITAISLARERSILQPRVIFVIIKLVCYSRLQKRAWLVEGVSYVGGDHVRWVSMQ